VYGYLERMKKAGLSEEQITEAERIMSDTAYSQLYKHSRREKSEDDQIMDIRAAWKFIAEVIERTEGKKL
jgi:orotate phosphoribosyltransferase-like protein